MIQRWLPTRALLLAKTILDAEPDASWLIELFGECLKLLAETSKIGASINGVAYYSNAAFYGLRVWVASRSLAPTGAVDGALESRQPDALADDAAGAKACETIRPKVQADRSATRKEHCPTSRRAFRGSPLNPAPLAPIRFRSNTSHTM